MDRRLLGLSNTLPLLLRDGRAVARETPTEGVWRQLALAYQLAASFATRAGYPDWAFAAVEKQPAAARDGDRVLEIGTATGYVAAPLSERLGSDRVVSVEIDAALSQRAAATLADHGFSPRLVVGDGAEGWEEGAPYDRLISTCALRHIPYALVRQVAPGGLIVAPPARAFWSGAPVRLSVEDNGIARGPFRGGASYMPMRSHRLPDAGPVDSGTARPWEAVTDPGHLLGLGFALYAGARLPGVTMSHAEAGTAVTVWLQDAAGSAAVAATGESVGECGERNLWPEVEAVYAEYVTLGQPDGDSFGLSVTPTGQEVWLRSPRTVIAAV
ncbi:methyltransferase domain-containing protein [Streptomyces sp. NPDC088261]|uniref:methyltransferase domain-containing protein n=1 Tax=Streptomyces sp. NPDC088261 TaxID=3365851 RepID=UPI003810B632